MSLMSEPWRAPPGQLYKEANSSGQLRGGKSEKVSSGSFIGDSPSDLSLQPWTPYATLTKTSLAHLCFHTL